MTDVALPSSPIAALVAVELTADREPVLQAFFEANPPYFEAVHGEPARPGEAREEIHEGPPAGWPYTRKWVIGYREPSGSLAAMANVISDLLAAGVWHIGTFIVATERHGSGEAGALYRSLEAWACACGARWMRLGVVAGHRRAERFWTRCGYNEVRTRPGVAMGRRVNTIRVMVKPLRAQPIAEYFALVERDRPDPDAAAGPESQ